MVNHAEKKKKEDNLQPEKLQALKFRVDDAN